MGHSTSKRERSEAARQDLQRSVSHEVSGSVSWLTAATDGFQGASFVDLASPRTRLMNAYREHTGPGQHDSLDGNADKRPAASPTRASANHESSREATKNVSEKMRNRLEPAAACIGSACHQSPRGSPGDGMRSTRTLRHGAMMSVKSSARHDAVSVSPSPNHIRKSKSASASGDQERQRPQLEIMRCVKLARECRVEPWEVRELFEDFVRLDTSGDMLLSVSEFEETIRRRCNIPKGQSIPPHLLDQQWRMVDSDRSGGISFEEYLLWCVNHAWQEELLVTDPKEREIRRIAREHKFNLSQVEEVRKVFDKFDADKSGSIDMNEFQDVVASLTGVPIGSDSMSVIRLRQLFREVDRDGSGEIGFEEFVVWCITIGW